MKKLFLVSLAIWSSVSNSYSQSDYGKYARSNKSQEQNLSSKQDNEKKQTENQDYYNVKSITLFDNSVFRVGDSIYVGIPRDYYCCKAKTFSYIDDLDVLRNNYYYTNSQVNIALTKFPITNIFKEENSSRRFDQGTDVVEFGSKGFFGKKYYANIIMALQNGEIILNKAPSNTLNAEILTDSLVFLLKTKTSKLPLRNFAEEALFRLHPDKFEKTKNDEFDFNSAVNESLSELNNFVNNISLERTFYTRIDLESGNYDFNVSAFPVTKWEIYQFGDAKMTDKSLYSSNQLVFINADDCSLVPVDKQTANGFIKRRKNDQGYIDRRIYAKVYFNIVEIPQNSPASERYKNDQYNTYLFAKIKRIELYDFKHCYYNFLGSLDIK